MFKHYVVTSRQSSHGPWSSLTNAFFNLNPMLFSIAGALALGTKGEILNFSEVEAASFGNMKVIPCPGTLHALPWVTPGQFSVGEVLCETRWLGDNPQEMCPRYMARNQLEHMREHDYMLTSSFEIEFMLLRGEGKEPFLDGHNIFSMYKLSILEPFLYKVDSFLRGSGVDVESLGLEYANGQVEITANRAEGIIAADTTFIVKEALKEICAQKSQMATFMTKPFSTDISNGLHFNHSVYNSAGHNVFYDATADDNLADIARYWLAGLIAHAGALTAICSPTVNCYRRLHQPWAPDYADWGIEDRFAAFRVKNKTEKRTYIENRIPGGSANPYLVLAATVAAGMDGVMRKLDCPDQRVNKPNAVRLPDSLAQALKELQEDHVMVEALGEPFVRWFVRVKTEIELEKLKDVDIKGQNVEKEQELYMDML